MATNILTSLGGGSGIDTIALVDSLIAAERAPKETILDSKTKTLETQISGYGALRSAMTGIQDSMNLLADADTFNARNVAFADTTLVTPTSVDPGAAIGDYSINVTKLASAHSLSASGFSDADAVVGNGTLTFSFGDWDAGFTTLDATGSEKATKTLTIDESNNTLNGIRDAINNGDFGVQASVIETSGSYAIQLTSESGASNEMKISVTEGAPSGLSAFQFDEASQTMAENTVGVDAAFKLNGLDITRSTNNIDDVIDGLEFTLNGISADANDNMTVSVEADKSFGEQIVRDFVEAYNIFLEQTGNLTTPADVDEDAEDQTLGSLSRDPTTKTMVNQVRSLISSTITGLDGNYTALATIGIQTQISGDLEINEDLFEDALDNNFNALTNIFAGTSSTSDARLGIVKTSASTQAGTYDVVVTTDPAKGYAAGGSISATDATDLGLTTATGVFAGGLDTSAGDYSFQIKVDGTTSNTITLSGNYANTDALIADLQAQINGDSNLSAVAAAVDISYDTASGSFTTTSRTYGDNSTIEFSNISSDVDRFALGGGATAAAVNSAAVVEPMTDTSANLTAGSVINAGVTAHVAGVFTSALDTSVGDYSMTVKVDGADVTVDLASIDVGNGAGIFNSTEEIRGALDSALTGASVSYDGGSNSYSITSDSSGTSSTIEVTAAAAEMANLGFSVAAEVAGEVDSFVTPLDTTGYAFDITTDTGFATISLGATYNSAEEVRAALQLALDGAGVGATASYDSANDKFSFASTTTGAASSIDISNLQGGIANLGISVDTDNGRDALATTSGVDVAGTIDGVAAFGSGNILLPELGSALSGLSLEVAAGVTSATITIAQGFGNEVNNILNTFLENNGLIATRETRMNEQLSDIDTDRTTLDRQMEARHAMLQSQFLAMEAIIRSLNATSSSLDGLVDRLPFTAQK
ncbi:MAG: flagellar filament capping protein FliD [Halopseudomonas sp.]